MSPRLRRTLIGSLPYIAIVALTGLTMPDEDRSTWFLISVPLCAAVSFGMAWFVWNRPSQMRDREVSKQQREAHALELARRATYGA
jgi:hypothetical protein